MKKVSSNSCVGSYHVEYTGSRPIPEVKQRRAESVPGRETAWEHSVSYTFFGHSFLHLFCTIDWHLNWYSFAIPFDTLSHIVIEPNYRTIERKWLPNLECNGDHQDSASCWSLMLTDPKICKGSDKEKAAAMAKIHNKVIADRRHRFNIDWLLNQISCNKCLLLKSCFVWSKKGTSKSRSFLRTFDQK